MNPYERWDDWEWEKAAQEVGKESGISPRWKPKQRGRFLKTNNQGTKKSITSGPGFSDFIL